MDLFYTNSRISYLRSKREQENSEKRAGKLSWNCRINSTLLAMNADVNIFEKPKRNKYNNYQSYRFTFYKFFIFCFDSVFTYVVLCMFIDCDGKPLDKNNHVFESADDYYIVFILKKKIASQFSKFWDKTFGFTHHDNCKMFWFYFLYFAHWIEPLCASVSVSVCVSPYLEWQKWCHNSFERNDNNKLSDNEYITQQ